MVIGDLIWRFCEFYHIRIPFAHIVFGWMIGSKGISVKKTEGNKEEK